ncbi:hypothetical protein [Mycobacterium sp. SMC-4]|uniref:hypothetical protein n=1 Tax=Mycobacterium sp. SMC-4 TaxID=2857059 RepID=UPI003CFE04AF
MTLSPPPKARGLVGNSMALLALSYATSFLGYVFWVICARSVPPGAIGMANTVISAMTLVAILAVAGFIPLLTRLLPGAGPEKRNGLFSTALLVTIVASGTFAVVGAQLLPSRLHDNIGTGWLLTLLTLGTVGTAIMFVTNAALLGVRRADFSLLGTMVGSVSRLVAIAALLLLGAATVGADASATHTILIVWVASLAITLTLSIRLLARATPNFAFRPRLIWLTQLRRSVGWDHIATLAMRAPTFVIPILAAAVFPTDELGYITVTVMVATVFFAIAASISNSLLADCADDPTRLRAQAKRAARMIALLLSVPVTITCLFAKQILSIFGPGYADYSFLLIMLLLATFPDALINVAMTILRVQQRLAVIALFTVTGATISIGGSWLLMPHFGALGAGVAVLTAQVVTAILFTVGGLYRFRAAQGADKSAAHTGIGQGTTEAARS